MHEEEDLMGRMSLARRATVAIAAGAMALSLMGTAHAQPNPAQRAVVLTSPGVVFITSDVTVGVKLQYGDLLGDRTRVMTERYSLPYGSGSGFVVSPDGTIVTASHVVEPDQKALQNYAANMVVAGIWPEYEDDFAADPYIRYNITDNGFIRNLLDQCYRGERCEFNIKTNVNVLTAVSIAGTDALKGEPARILGSTGFGQTDVAVLDIGATDLPTVALADSTGDLTTGDEVTGLGFPGSNQGLEEGVTEPTNIFGRVSNIRSEGTSEIIEVDADLEPGMSGGPVIDQRGKVIGLVSFGLLQSSGESGSEYLRTVDDIKAAMADAGVSASRGPVDSAFAGAMDLFWGNHFTAAVPEFQKVLALSDGHPLAKDYLAQSQAKAGTPADVPVDEGGLPIALIGAIGGGVLLLGLALLLVLRARRKKPAMAPMGPAPAEAPAMETIPPAAPAGVAPQDGPAATPQNGPVEMAPQNGPADTTAPMGQASHPVGFQGSASGNPAPEPAAVGTSAAPAPEAAAPAPAPEAAAPAPAPAEGEAAPQARFCTNCGQQNTMDAHFCARCGHAL